MDQGPSNEDRLIARAISAALLIPSGLLILIGFILGRCSA